MLEFWKKARTPEFRTVPYLICVCPTKSATLAMGGLIFFTVRKAAKLAEEKEKNNDLLNFCTSRPYYTEVCLVKTVS